jgi:hypothetical protein
MLTRLLYASRATAKIDDALLRAILERSRAENLAHGITGVLCAYPEGHVFLQAIEGSRSAVNALYAALLRDPRHRDVTLLEYAEIDERRFGGWLMGAVDLGKVNRRTILRYSERAELDPFSMSARSAIALLEELTTSGAIVSHD